MELNSLPEEVLDNIVRLVDGRPPVNFGLQKECDLKRPSNSLVFLSRTGRKLWRITTPYIWNQLDLNWVLRERVFYDSRYIVRAGSVSTPDQRLSAIRWNVVGPSIKHFSTGLENESSMNDDELLGLGFCQSWSCKVLSNVPSLATLILGGPDASKSLHSLEAPLSITTAVSMWQIPDEEIGARRWPIDIQKLLRMSPKLKTLYSEPPMDLDRVMKGDPTTVIEQQAGTGSISELTSRFEKIGGHSLQRILSWPQHLTSLYISIGSAKRTTSFEKDLGLTDNFVHALVPVKHTIRRLGVAGNFVSQLSSLTYTSGLYNFDFRSMTSLEELDIQLRDLKVLLLEDASKMYHVTLRGLKKLTITCGAHYELEYTRRDRCICQLMQDKLTTLPEFVSEDAESRLEVITLKSNSHYDMRRLSGGIADWWECGSFRMDVIEEAFKGVGITLKCARVSYYDNWA